MPWSYYLKLILLGVSGTILASLVYFWWQNLPTDHITLYFLNVGQGDAVLIKGRLGQEILIDGGKDQKILGELATVLPIYDRNLDVVLATHPDLDHYGGLLSVLNTYQVKVFIDNGAFKDSLTYDQFQRLVSEQKIAHFVARRGMTINLDLTAKLTILYPDTDTTKLKEANDGSIVAMLEYGKERVLLTGDAPQDVEFKLVNYYQDKLQAEILKLGHHGSRTSSSQLFLERVKPVIGIISAGLNNRYGHPHSDVIERLNKLGIAYKNTAYDGRQCFKIYPDHFSPCY